MMNVDKPCSCGSGLQRRAAIDARGIFLTYVCDRCAGIRLEAFRREVLENPNYHADEPIDEED